METVSILHGKAAEDSQMSAKEILLTCMKKQIVSEHNTAM